MRKSKKEINQVNHLQTWVILIIIAFFITTVIFILIADLTILRNKNVIKDWHLRLVFLALAFYTVVRYINKIVKYFAERLNNRYLQRFHFLKDTQTYEEARERVHFKQKEYTHVVILLHGFSASPQEFQFLTELLDKHGINYYAPHITGFGSNNTQILNKTTRYDWYRNALDCFDLLSSVADRVSIIGHSMGGILATYVAARRNVHHLILTAPGLYCFPADLKYKIILTTPVLSSLYIKLVPYLPKPVHPDRSTVCDMLDSEQAEKVFQYMAIPMNSLRELAHAQDEFSPKQLKFTKLTIMYGEQELTVDINKLFEILDTNKIQYKSFCFKNSAHNVLEDFDKIDCCESVIKILTSKQ